MKDGSNVRVVMMHHVNFLPPSLLLLTTARMSAMERRASSLTRCSAISIPSWRRSCSCSPHAIKELVDWCTGRVRLPCHFCLVSITITIRCQQQSCVSGITQPGGELKHLLYGRSVLVAGREMRTNQRASEPGMACIDLASQWTQIGTATHAALPMKDGGIRSGQKKRRGGADYIRRPLDDWD